MSALLADDEPIYCARCLVRIREHDPCHFECINGHPIECAADWITEADMQERRAETAKAYAEWVELNSSRRPTRQG